MTPDCSGRLASCIALSLLTLIGITFGPARASAGLIASDSYLTGSNPSQGQYAVGSSINSQPGNVVTGFATGGYGSGNQGTSNFLISGTGLSSTADGSDSTSSGSVYFNGPGGNGYSSVARNLSSFNEGTTGTYWMSMLVQTDGTNTAANAFVLSGFGNTVPPVLGATAGYLSGIYIGFDDNAVTGQSDLVLRARTTSAETATDTVLVSGAGGATTNNTYLVVCEVNINYSGSLDQVTTWVNPSDLNSVSDLGTPVSTLNTYAYQGAATGNGDFTRLNYVEDNWNSAYTAFDEQRLGTTLASIAPQSAIPEPASLALTLVGVGLTWIRQRRQKVA